jgi:hypothetical protein
MSARPGRVIERLPISLERPRTIEMTSGVEFGRYALQIRAMLGRTAGASDLKLSA